MTLYTFKPSDDTQFAKWSDSSFWIGGVVPNGADADVLFPAVTYVSNGQPYISYVTIQSGETYSVHSVTSNDYLTVNGTLNVAGDLTQSDEMTLNGTLTAGTFNNNSQFEATGQLTAGTFNNNDAIVTSGGAMMLDATSMTNNGSLYVGGGGTLSLTVTPGGFTNFSNGTLSGGSYASYSFSNDSTTSLLSLDVGGVITTDDASITLGGGMITSHDPITGQDVSLTTSLHDITSAGQLTIGYYDAPTMNYGFGSLTDAGTITVDNGQFSATQLSLTSTGTLQGNGVVNAPIENQGLIQANGYQTLVLNGAITGSGHIEVSGGLELNGATAQDVQFDSGMFQIDHPDSFTGTITAAAVGERIILPGISYGSITGSTYSGTDSGGTLTVQEAGGASLSFAFAGSYTASSFTISPGPQLLSSDPPSLAIQIGHAAGPPVCFLAGVRILTPTGERAVETLRVGDTVTNWASETRTITWIGSATRIANRLDSRTSPVIVRAGALADGVPARDLRITEGHSLFLEGRLIPVASLINGRSILWDEAARIFTVFHVELAGHDILIADGAPAESYRDDGNRRSFPRADGMATTDAGLPFAPIETAGPLVDAVWQRLVERIDDPVVALTDHADLHLLIDGVRFDPVEITGDRYRFVLKHRPNDIHIASRAVVPALAGTRRDFRRLGVAVRGITASISNNIVRLDYRSELLDGGFHEAEHGGSLRWTDGCGRISAMSLPIEDTVVIEVEIACFAQYPVDDDQAVYRRLVA